MKARILQRLLEVVFHSSNNSTIDFFLCVIIMATTVLQIKSTCTEKTTWQNVYSVKLFCYFSCNQIDTKLLRSAPFWQQFRSNNTRYFVIREIMKFKNILPYLSSIENCICFKLGARREEYNQRFL